MAGHSFHHRRIAAEELSCYRKPVIFEVFEYSSDSRDAKFLKGPLETIALALRPLSKSFAGLFSCSPA
jgi:hypothetical protein